MARALIPFGLFILVALIPATGNAYLVYFVFAILVSFILAQSWDWIAGEAGLINLGHYVFFGIGAYTFSIGVINDLPIALCFVFAAGFTSLVAAILGIPLFRLTGDYFAFATLALLPLAELLASNLASITGGSDGIPLPPGGGMVFGFEVKTVAYYMALVFAVGAIVVTMWITRSPFGYALKAVRNDEEAAEILGVRIFPTKIRALVLSALAASLAGSVYAWSFRYIDPSTVFGLNSALLPVAMALLGGSGLLWGPLIGVLLLSVAQQLLLTNLTILQATIYGLVILFIGRYMPGGLLRAASIRRLPGLKALGREHHEYLTERGPSPTMAAVKEIALRRYATERDGPLLVCDGVTMAFGGNVAVNGVSLSIDKGEIIGLIGPNGSGKTTFFNCISKVYEPVAGRIILDGHDLGGVSRYRVSRLGVGRTYQIPRPFQDLTVVENIAIPLMFRERDSLPLRRAFVEAGDFASFAGLEDHLDVRADLLSLQHKKALEFARALACKPKLLLLDEVASGLTPAEVKRFVAQIRHVRDAFGLTVIWVEHIISALSLVVDRIVVMEEGATIADGNLREVMKDEKVLKTYLGTVSKEAG